MVAIGRSVLCAVLLALAWNTESSQASPLVRDSNGNAEDLVKRAPPAITAPSGWKLSYTLTGKRQSYPSSIAHTILATSGDVNQNLATTCVSQCSNTNGCGFVNLVSIQGSSQASVVCMMFKTYLASNKATYTSGPYNLGGTIASSYGIRSLCAPTTGKALTCTPAKVSPPPASPPTATTTTVTTPTATPSPVAPGISTLPGTFPASPPGATLLALTPCAGTTAYNPAFGNQLFVQGSNSEVAYISQHGSGNDFNNYFTNLYNVVGNNAPIVSPGIMQTDMKSAPTTWYQPGQNLVWPPGVDTWGMGTSATGPTTGAYTLNNAQCSPFDQFDQIISYYMKSGKFPNLKTIVITGHSLGGTMVSRYSTIHTQPSGVHFRYVVANPPNQAYFSTARPWQNPCSDAFVYGYQWQNNFPAYVDNKFKAINYDQPTLFKNWITRDVVHLVGDRDVETTGTQACQSIAAGGPYRRDRNYAYWAYINILGATGTDVSQYFGYGNLTISGALPILGATGFNHQQCTAAGIAHDGAGIYVSQCGRSAFAYPLTQVSGGAGASYPSDLPY